MLLRYDSTKRELTFNVESDNDLYVKSVDFYCGESLDDVAIILGSLLQGSKSLQEAHTDILKLINNN